jgi:hypothetical protein
MRVFVTLITFLDEAAAEYINEIFVSETAEDAFNVVYLWAISELTYAEYTECLEGDPNKVVNRMYVKLCADWEIFDRVVGNTEEDNVYESNGICLREDAERGDSDHRFTVGNGKNTSPRAGEGASKALSTADLRADL